MEWNFYPQRSIRENDIAELIRDGVLNDQQGKAVAEHLHNRDNYQNEGAQS